MAAIPPRVWPILIDFGISKIDKVVIASVSPLNAPGMFDWAEILSGSHRNFARTGNQYVSINGASAISLLVF